jgi:hypothetical protein
VFHGRPACYLITRRGLRTVGSSLPPPRLDLLTVEHEIGLGWLWLAAHRGSFGALREVISERRMRSEDGVRSPYAAPWAVRVPGLGGHGGSRLHYPDLMLHTASGHRVAVELELTGKSRARREGILRAYSGERRVDAVLYLVERESIGREVAGSASRLGIARMVHVQRVRRGSAAPVGGASLSRQRVTQHEHTRLER